MHVTKEFPVANTERQDDMWILSQEELDGPFVVEVRTDDDASTLGSYWNAVGHYLDTGATSRLADFDDVEVAGFRLETDPDEIDFWARSGDLQFQDIYES